MQETIESLKGLSFDEIFGSFEKAFSDYEVGFTKEQVKRMLVRRGFIPDLSFGIFLDDNLVSFTLNGIGNFKGVKTAYDTGTGTIKEFRGKGFAQKIFNHSIPFLKESKIRQYLLEVLQNNAPAVSVYRKLGFSVTREFNYFTVKNDDLTFKKQNVDGDIAIRKVELDTICKNPFQDFEPSWQNSFEAVGRKPDDFIILGAYLDSNLTGYCIFEPFSGDLTQIAVKDEYRRQGIGTLLLKQALQSTQYSSVKVINTEISCFTITKFLKARGFSLDGKQFEMIKPL
jgi:ribosomal protein S18 acetylase RimI-like enzyme